MTTMQSADDAHIEAAYSWLASPGDQPMQFISEVGQLVAEAMDVDFVTFSVFDLESGASKRIYSSRPKEYPVSGMKPMNRTWWTDWVIKDKKTFVANSIAEIAEVFFDYSEIKNLGCESVINVPIVVYGDVVGTINCLGKAGHFRQELVARSEMLKLHGALAILGYLYSEAA